MTEPKLDTLIEKYEENRWIDCAWDDLDDEKEFETIMKYLKENKILKEKLEQVKMFFTQFSVENGELIRVDVKKVKALFDTIQIMETVKE